MEHGRDGGGRQRHQGQAEWRAGKPFGGRYFAPAEGSYRVAESSSGIAGAVPQPLHSEDGGRGCGRGCRIAAHRAAWFSPTATGPPGVGGFGSIGRRPSPGRGRTAAATFCTVPVRAAAATDARG